MQALLECCVIFVRASTGDADSVLCTSLVSVLPPSNWEYLLRDQEALSDRHNTSVLRGLLSASTYLTFA